jgi:hypothetical protein
MGREARDAAARFGGQAGPVTALLEADELILRGAVRARLPRAGLTDWRVAGDALHLVTPEGPLVLTLGAAAAAAWARALDRPAPTLAQKLGLGAAVLAVGVTDPALAAVLAGRAGTPAALVVAEVHDAGMLRAAVQAAEGRPLWVATVKGRGTPFGADAVRAALRGAGWVDSKSCAVSDRLTATRYTLAQPRGDAHMAATQEMP